MLVRNLFLLLLCFLVSPIVALGNSVAPQVDFTIKPAQDVIVKPANNPAGGTLDIRLSPSGKATNVNVDPIDVVFIFDKSGSMDDLNPGDDRNPQKLLDAKKAMTTAINTFKKDANPKDRFAFIPFSSDIETDKMIPFSPIANNSLQDVENNLIKIKTNSDSLKALGGTNYTQSFEEATSFLSNSNNKKFVFFLTDGNPTHSQNIETIKEVQRVKVGTERKCFWGFCWDEDVFENKEVDVNRTVYYEISTYIDTGKKVGNVFYYKDNNKEYIKDYKNTTDIKKVKEIENAIRQQGIDRVKKFAEKDIKLYSIGFGSDQDVDKNYLETLSSITGTIAQQASGDSIGNIFKDISEKMSTPTISTTIKINADKYKGKIQLAENAGAKMDGNGNIEIKKDVLFPINQESTGGIDISLPLLFNEIGTYTFDDITLEYTGLDKKPVKKVHNPVTIKVAPDAPASFTGSTVLGKVVNDLTNLIKVTDSTDDKNAFKVLYNLQPTGLVNTTVSGSLTNLVIKQSIPNGVTLVPTANVTLETINGTRYAVLNLVNEKAVYSQGTFSKTQINGEMKFKVDWAVTNLNWPKATLEYKDTRFNSTQSTSISAPQQTLSMKVRLNVFPNFAYDGDSTGVIEKLDLANILSVAKTEFPNSYGLDNKPVKDLKFKTDSQGKIIEITYFDDVKASIHLTPNFELKGIGTNQLYPSGSTAQEAVELNLVNPIPGKGVKYFYSTENAQSNTSWTEFTIRDKISLATPGLNNVKVKAVGGFALSDLEVQQQITIIKKITNLQVEPSSIEVGPGKSEAFTVSIEPVDATNKDLEFIIDDPSIATVDITNKRILGLKPGSTDLLVKTKDGSNLSKTVSINVKSKFIKLTEVKFKKSAFKINLDEEVAVEEILIFNPYNATEKDIAEVTSSLPIKVKVVEQDGKWYIIGKEIGYSTVKAVAEQQDDGTKPEDSALFEVVNDKDGDSEGEGPKGSGRW